MKQKLLKKKYDEILKVVELATGRKETISLLRKAEKIRTKITKKVRYNCKKCNGFGYRRTSIDDARTCLHCYGKGYILKNSINKPDN